MRTPRSYTAQVGGRPAVDLVPAEHHHGGSRRRLGPVLAPLAFVACSVWLYLPLVRHLRSAQMGGPDTSLFTWWLGWTPYAISHGHSPFISTWVNVPQGVNAMWNTSVPLLGALMAPVTEIWGPVASVNLLLIAAPALSAESAFLAGRLFGLRMRSAFLVGFLYGFSTYELAQDSSGHLHLSMAVFPPLAAVLVHRLVTGSISTRRGGLLLGLISALQLWVSEEILATSGVLTVLALVVLALRSPRETVNAVGRQLLSAASWALVVLVALTGPALMVQFFGRGHISSGVELPTISTDLLNAFVPTGQTLLGNLVPHALTQRIQGGYADEITGYVGLPLLVLLVAGRRRIRLSKLHWCWTPFLVAATLTVGWTLTIDGYSLGVPGPGRVMARLPVLSSILTTRLSLYVVLFAALLVAAIWDASARTAGRPEFWINLAVALVVVAALPWPPSATITRISEPAAFSDGRALPGLPDGATVAMLPWPTVHNDDAMRWQALDGFHFRLVGAYGIVAGTDGGGDYGSPVPELDQVATSISTNTSTIPATEALFASLVTGELAQLRLQASAIVIGPTGNQREIASYIGTLLHQRPQLTSGVYVLRLR